MIRFLQPEWFWALTVLPLGSKESAPVTLVEYLPPETLVVLEETLQEVNRMTELVDALLTLARADEGRAPLARAGKAG